MNFDEPVSPRSNAWCMMCDWRAWGIWSHAKAHAHHLDRRHVVQLDTPTETEPDER